MTNGFRVNSSFFLNQRALVRLLLSSQLAELSLDDSVAGLLQSHELESVEVGQVSSDVLSGNTLGQVGLGELGGDIGGGESLKKNNYKQKWERKRLPS